MHASRSAEWKETVIIIGFFYFEMIASSVPFITWPILYFMIEKQKSVKPETDSDHLDKPVETSTDTSFNVVHN